MILRPDIDEVMDRTKRFSMSDKKGIALIQVKSIASVKTPKIKPLNQWKFPDETKEYLDMCLQKFIAGWKERLTLEDDLIPAISPRFGIAEHSAFIGGNVDFSTDTSWHHPIIHEWTDLDRLELREDNQWLGMLIGGMEYLKEKSMGQYAVKFRGANGPLDIANALRGNELLTDFYDYPDEIHQLMDFCVKAAEWTLSKQKAVAEEFFGGIISGFDVWLPRNSIGHLSEDVAALCSPDIYNTFGKPYTEKLCSKYDHAFMHTHGLGEHTFKSIADIKKIDFIEISNDPNCPRAIEILKRNLKLFKDKTVVLDLTFDEMRDNIDTLQQVKTVLWYKAESLEDAEKAIRFTRGELNF